MRALLRDAQDQTRIALEVEEAVRANADSIIEELVMKGYSDLTQFESEQDE
mgnify:CR=1 FL=1